MIGKYLCRGGDNVNENELVHNHIVHKFKEKKSLPSHKLHSGQSLNLFMLMK